VVVGVVYANYDEDKRSYNAHNEALASKAMTAPLAYVSRMAPTRNAVLDRISRAATLSCKVGWILARR
jgi:hypothetical protein